MHHDHSLAPPRLTGLLARSCVALQGSPFTLEFLPPRRELCGTVRDLLEETYGEGEREREWTCRDVREALYSECERGVVSVRGAAVSEREVLR